MTCVPGTRGWRATPERPTTTILLAGTWRAREGEEDAIREIVETIVPLARAEPGCRAFSAHRSADDPRTFFLYSCLLSKAPVIASAIWDASGRVIRDLPITPERIWRAAHEVVAEHP